MIGASRFSRLFAFASLICSGCAIDHEAPVSDIAPITKEGALELQMPDLAKRVMGPLAGIVNEVSRPTFVGLPGGDASLQYLSFATKADSAGYAGLCEAEVISVRFSIIGSKEYPATKDTPVRPIAIDTRYVFKIVGNTEHMRGQAWTNASIEELKVKCAEAGRVLPTETGDFSQARYFDFFGLEKHSASNDAWIAAIVLQRALEIAKSGTSPMPTCDPSACSSAAGVMRDLSLSSLLAARVEPCLGSTRTCIEGEFPESKLKPTWHWVIRAEVDVGERAYNSEDIGPIHKIEISYKPPIVD